MQSRKLYPLVQDRITIDLPRGGQSESPKGFRGRLSHAHELLLHIGRFRAIGRRQPSHHEAALTMPEGSPGVRKAEWIICYQCC
jgi:hypothetical protein